MGKAKDSDNLEWTLTMIQKARSAKEVFPGAPLPKPRGRGKQKAETKVQTTIRLDRDVVDHFKREGHGWQSRINAVLRRVVDKKAKKRA